jgi:hypothetical protein
MRHLKYSKICLYCKKEFIATRNDAQFCSSACRSIYRRLNPLVKVIPAPESKAYPSAARMLELRAKYGKPKTETGIPAAVIKILEYDYSEFYIRGGDKRNRVDALYNDAVKAGIIPKELFLLEKKYGGTRWQDMKKHLHMVVPKIKLHRGFLPD